jgi:hypothetical protein
MAQVDGFSTVNDNEASRDLFLALAVSPNYDVTDNVTTSTLNKTSRPSSNDLSNLTTATPARSEELTTDPATVQWMMILQWVFAGVGILGIISNLFVLVVVLRAKKFRQKPRNWFIFHQSLADLISAVSMVLISTRNTDLLTLSDVSKVLN